MQLTVRQREAITGLLFVAPQLIGFAVFVGGPLLGILAFGLFDWNVVRGTFHFVGLDNYRTAFSSEEVARVARITVAFGLGFVPVTVVIGLALAIAVDSRTRVAIVLRSAYFLPVVISLAAWTVVWRLVLQSNGPLNGLLEAVLEVDGPRWLRDPTLALVSAISVQVLKAVGYAMILFLAALQTVPADVREAARVDGAGEWPSFRRIVWPIIAPFTFMVVILLSISSFRSFALIDLLTGGGPGGATTVMSYYIYEQGLQLFEMGYASSLAVLLFVAVLGLTLTQFSIRRRWVDEGD